MVIDPLLAAPLALFVTETEGYARTANEQLLALERGEGDLEKRHQQVARLLHTMKGTSATFGLAGLSDAAHRMESALGAAHAAQGPLPAPLADALLRCFDGFVATLRACTAGQEEPPFPPALLAALGAPGTGRGSGAAPAADPVSTPAPVPVSAAAAAPPPAPAPVFALMPDPSPTPGLGPATVAGRASVRPASPSTPPPLAAEPELADAPDQSSWHVQAADIAAFTREIEHLRDLHLRFDARTRDLARLLEAADALLAAPKLRPLRDRLADLRTGLAADGEETSEVIEALEGGVKRICTLPVRTVLDPLHRAVRDLCRASGRRARMSIVGGDAVLDRRLLDALRGPLVQLVRNAVDHGVEAPEVRRAANKDPEAQIIITVEQQGNLVFLEVADDGAGIDRAAVGAAAVARGLVTRERLAALSAPELDRLVFAPGLSTRAEVSEVSGRGVGLDVVLAEVRALDGSIDVQTTPGQGTRFAIHLPMEIGSSWLLVVTAVAGSYGVPLAAVEAVVAARDEVLRVGRRHMSLEYVESLIPIVDLGWMLGQRERKAPAAGQPLLIVQAAGRRIALAVDHVGGEQDLVVRALPPELRALPQWQGAATLARGDFLLVLRPEWMVTQDAREEPVMTRRVLVVDDSVTARALHRAVLESGGYTVHAVPSGEQALQQIGEAPYDVVISDITMEPGALDGLELVARLRATPTLAQLPVILVSVADEPALRARALALGADAYLTKKECASGRLLGEVAAVLSRRRTGSRA
jgi:chemotaxis protein histidine kinase CheA